MNEKLEKDYEIKTGKEIFMEWKIENNKSYNFDKFMQILNQSLGNLTKIKIDDDDFINDCTTLCCLIKNDLDELVLN